VNREHVAIALVLLLVVFGQAAMREHLRRRELAQDLEELRRCFREKPRPTKKAEEVLPLR
jgi:hypothetical protein